MNIFASIWPDATHKNGRSQQHWLNNAVKQTWQPNISKIADAKPFLFAHAVQAGLYSCALFTANAGQILELEERLERDFGLHFWVLDGPPQQNNLWQTTAQVFPVVIGLPQAVTLFQSSWRHQHKVTLFSLLKIPFCCRHFHDKQANNGDTLLARAFNSPSLSHQFNKTIRIEGPPVLNNAINWFNIELLSHEPCSMQCEQSTQLAERWLQIGIENGYGDEIATLKEMLSWSTEWQRRGRQLVVKLPIITISTTAKRAQESSTLQFAPLPGDGQQTLGFISGQRLHHHEWRRGTG